MDQTPGPIGYRVAKAALGGPLHLAYDVKVEGPASLPAGPVILAANDYPEGTRSRDGRLHRGHLGPARMAVASGAPLVPVGLLGTQGVQAPDQRIPRVGKQVTVRFGLPRWPRPGPTGGGSATRDLTDLVMADIAELCGQPCAERFATVGS